ncbi:aldo-keto reductase family 1 member C4-like isoform X2 [Zophobas morio]|uniref:aldo-keto reductase family 1 member C4-like isoform X2 n=1 Tax=Zophobas morio TaxID=2755281 RepID=UPI0030828E87
MFSGDEKESKAVLNAALEAGYRHIDTAYAYNNEKFIGDVLKEWFASGKLKREDVFITTKLPMYGVHPDRVEFFMKKSLQNLQLDYVDLYLVHFPVGVKYDESTGRPALNEKNRWIAEGKTDHEGIWKKMEEQVKAGRTKTIGLSNYNISQIETVLKHATIKPANLQVELHVYLQQRQLVDFCHKNGITVVAFSPLGSPGYNKFLKQMGRNEKQLPDILGDPVVAKISKKYLKTPAQIVLRFLIQQGISCIPKTISEKRLKENIAVFDFALDDGDIKELLNLDIGEEARVRDFSIFEGLDEHPDFPLKT